MTPPNTSEGVTPFKLLKARIFIHEVVLKNVKLKLNELKAESKIYQIFM